MFVLKLSGIQITFPQYTSIYYKVFYHNFKVEDDI